MTGIDIAPVATPPKGTSEQLGGTLQPNASGAPSQRTGSEARAPGYRFKPSDYMSLAALIIAAVTAIYSLLGWLQGPTILFRSPELVSFHCYPAIQKQGSLECGPNSNVMIAATNMTYVNEGRPEYGGILLDETAILRISSRKDATLHWHEFSNVTTLATGAVTLASATVIPGSSSVAHETRFFARDEPCSAPCDPRSNFVPWSAFVAAVAEPARAVSIVFSARVSARGEIVRSGVCNVFMSEVDRAEFRKLGVGKTSITSLTCVTRSQ
jgi:hypothetical protein